MPFNEQAADKDVQAYKFGGKEYDTMHGLDQYDFHARQYDPAISRFNTVDPLAEKYYSISPYAYCANNPLKFVDPTGMVIDSLSQAQWISERDAILNQMADLNKGKNGFVKNRSRIESLLKTLGIFFENSRSFKN